MCPWVPIILPRGRDAILEGLPHRHAISGAAGDRALLVTAYALILLSRTAGSEVDSAPNVTSIWPAIRSCSTKEPPRYGTYWTCIPVIFWSNRPVACEGLPGPLVPKVILGLFALIHPTSSIKSLAGTAFLDSTSTGVLLRSAIGSKSPSRSCCSV